MIEHAQIELSRIADALERIAHAMEHQGAQEAPQVPQTGFTLTNPPLAWFVAQEAPQGAQEPSIAFASLTPSSTTARPSAGVIVQRGGHRVGAGRPKNRVSHCGRCGREETRRMNNSDCCRECVHEPWWTE